MISHPPPSSLMSGSKRPWQAQDDLRASNVAPFPKDLHSEPSPSSASSTSNVGASSSFRNVSACNRCRLRKNRCDQNLPACASCEKARVKCVGYDPITKREIPRAYVYYCESRISYLEQQLADRGIAYAPPDDFDLGTKPLNNTSATSSPKQERGTLGHGKSGHRSTLSDTQASSRELSPYDERREEADKLNKLVSNIGMVSVQGASDPRYLGSTSGISFARVVFAAVRSSVSSNSTSERANVRPSKPLNAATNGTSMRDSFFGLQSKPSMQQAPFPDKEVGEKLVSLYFEHANCQIPILHKREFISLFQRAYASGEKRRSPRELYMLNIVFAIGAAIILRDTSSDSAVPGQTTSPIKEEDSPPRSKKQKVSAGQQHQPEEYHASAMVHLESFLGSTPATDRPEGFGGSLEELQAVLLLAGFALLRPVAPGLWYIIGVAVRIAVDLGLHYEDGTGIEESGDGAGVATSSDVAMEAAGDGKWVKSNGIDSRERGRREWVRDLRRRLWWCVYSFDRLVSTCVGRPFGISDQVITTEFPCILDDKYIGIDGINAPPEAYNYPSYKRVAHHYFRLRLLQSEILQVLQYRQAKEARDKGRNSTNQFMFTKLSSPFLQPFSGSFRAWRQDIDKRLWEWKESAPRKEETDVAFSIQFLELNYWQAVIMLYRQSLSVPPTLAGEITPSDEISSPLSMATDDRTEDDEDVFLKVAEAGQNVLKLYRILHRVHLVNYTFLATHHLFMAGIAFLYAIWHSPAVRSRLTLDDVDFTVLAATSVLGDLMAKCPPAEACRDAFERMSKATIQMCMQTTGFGFKAASPNQMNLNPPPGTIRHGHSQSQPMNPRDNSMYQQHHPQRYFQAQDGHGSFRPKRPKPTFDTNLKDLFPEQSFENLPMGRSVPRRFYTHAAQPTSSGQTADFSNYQGMMRGSSTMPQMPYQKPQQQAQHQAAPQLRTAHTHPASQPSSAASTPTYQPMTYDAPSPRSGPSPHPLLAQQPSSSYNATTPPTQAAAYPSSPNPSTTAGYATPPPQDQQSTTYDASSAYSSYPVSNNNGTAGGGGPPTYIPMPGNNSSNNNTSVPHQMNYIVGGPFQPDHSFDSLLGLSDNTGTFTNQPGFALGFDTEHDWSEGGGMDLFDGFFFGNTAV